jgi:glycosyltransferase involved in cell wall biosynthesis
LGEAIESVLAQSYAHFEIIVVDDGSTDDTSEVATRYPGVRCISQHNQGLPAAARNRGLALSKGDYLVFLDADDRLLSDAFKVGLESLKAHPECAFVSGHYRNIAADGSLLATPKQPCPDKEHYLEILRANYIYTPAVVMYQRSVFKFVGAFNTSLDLRGSEDADLCMRIARDFPVYCHGTVVAEYRIHDSSLSHNAAHMLKASTTARHLQRKYVKGNRRYEDAIKQGVRAAQRHYGGRLAYGVLAHLREQEWKQAIWAMLILLRYYPLFFVPTWQKLKLPMRLRLWLRLLLGL